MTARRRFPGFALRCILLFGFWLLLLEPEGLELDAIAVDWAVGAVAAAAAALLSLRLLPPSAIAPRIWPLLRLLVRFLAQSLIAGFDVARRALDPRLPVRPGLLRQPTSLPEGMIRTLFGAVTSQVPGTLAVGSEDRGTLLYHCLNQTQDAARGLAADEVLFLKTLGDDGPGSPERQS
jgi:multicomponent Na+:H+ antiporter subunit E